MHEAQQRRCRDNGAINDALEFGFWTRALHAARGTIGFADCPRRVAMLSRRQFLHHASGALLTLGSAAAPVAQVVYDPTVLRHEPPGDHPESPKRITAVMETVRSLGRQGRLSVAAPRPATDDDVLLVHTPEYLKKVRAEI